MDKKTVEELIMRVAPFTYPKIMEELVKCNYFKAPATKEERLSQEGGLCKHSLNVCDVMAMLVMAFQIKIDSKDVILSGLFHDIETAFTFFRLPKKNVAPGSLASRVCRDLGFSEEIQNAVLWHEGMYSPCLWNLSQREMVEVLRDINKEPLCVLLYLADILTSFITERGEEK